MDILIGHQGSGKTKMCYRKIRQTLNKNAYQKIIMLVPEQFNLEAQKDLVEFLDTGLLFCDVLSFNTLFDGCFNFSAASHSLAESFSIACRA